VALALDRLAFAFINSLAAPANSPVEQAALKVRFWMIFQKVKHRQFPSPAMPLLLAAIAWFFIGYSVYPAAMVRRTD